MHHSRCMQLRQTRYPQLLSGPGLHFSIRSASRGCADEAPRLNDSVKGRPIHDQIADHREGAGAPRLKRKRVTILEEAHRELAHRSATLTSVGRAASHPNYYFPARDGTSQGEAHHTCERDRPSAKLYPSAFGRHPDIAAQTLILHLLLDQHPAGKCFIRC